MEALHIGGGGVCLVPCPFSSCVLPPWRSGWTWFSLSLISCSLLFFILCARDLAGPRSVCLSSPVPYRFSSCVLEIWLDPVQSVSVSLCHPYLPLLSSSFSTTWLISPDTACRQNPQPPPHSAPEKASEQDTGFQPPPVDLSFG